MEDYYQKNHIEYHNRTFSVNSSIFLTPLTRHIYPGATILDIGCGSGRDLLWLKNHEFNVTGFERSTGLAQLARGNSGCEVIEGDFETFDFFNLSFEAVIASGSLVHVPHKRFPAIFKNIIKALRNRGVPVHGLSCTLCYRGNYIYISLKEGEGTKTDSEGRLFYLWQDEDLRTIFNESGFSVLEFSRQKSAVNSKDVWLGYVLIND